MLKYYLNTMQKSALPGDDSEYESCGMNNLINLDNRLSLKNMIKICKEYQKKNPAYCLFKFDKSTYESTLIYR